MLAKGRLTEGQPEGNGGQDERTGARLCGEQSRLSRLAERRNAFPSIHEFHFMLSRLHARLGAFALRFALAFSVSPFSLLSPFASLPCVFFRFFACLCALVCASCPPMFTHPLYSFLLSLSLCFADIVGVRVYAGQPEALVFLLLALLAFPLFFLSVVNLNKAKH